ncbi:MAG: hypothetical protein IPJ84_10790 [Bdellovibrionales bacterium]|nr:hypothetical protein [Bdellovibrionales bacterium]
MAEMTAGVCFGRTLRFSAVIAEEAAIWDLSVEIMGVPDVQSGMVVSLPLVDLCLNEAASELQRGHIAPEVIANSLAAKIKKSGTESSRVKVTLDSGHWRQVLLLANF